MKFLRIPSFIVCLISTIPLGCSSWYQADLFPETALATLNTTLSFEHLKESPDSHQGVTLMLGGEVLEAKRFKDYTRLIVLQLPLTLDQAPERDRTRSKGRFLALQSEFLDPATLPQGTRLTLIGTVTGSTTEPLDETDYTYPTLTIQHLKVWPDRLMSPYAYYPYGYWPYGPYPYAFRGPYGYYPRWWYD